MTNNDVSVSTTILLKYVNAMSIFSAFLPNVTVLYLRFVFSERINSTLC